MRLVHRHVTRGQGAPDVGLASRRSALLAALAVASPVQRAVAEYGSGANVAPPALVPSPFVPQGELGKTCAVVALGREDVCLEFKKVLTAYDLLQLGKAKDKLDDLEFPEGSSSSLRELRDQLSTFLPSVEANDFDKVRPVLFPANTDHMFTC